jgi:hypothetical protein
MSTAPVVPDLPTPTPTSFRSHCQVRQYGSFANHQQPVAPPLLLTF